MAQEITLPHSLSRRLLRRLLRHLARWRRTRATRRALARLGPDQLRDIGLSAPEARREAARPFWH
ncbi:DUF1127 domain-containing protein [Phaeovulum vinaykumarii]|uniref:Uncharacterized conserved protein YjiS, DUF1127 family n=1 Tax=Phaeovulum vinaykumarii TaxID=407234 RepID=A0A1N7L2G5_9RHOB|nr:DUF1127 domain-containing protein [Phaeovulum vinaykumarii]SIS68048.1 Uncharacterized conserved protein YjiS, DUF1127 family [Phaeovulum vinaykumarii]SOC00378.1 uncharacterized protein YjiS [Phaeovulum vinaykumarii]